jgi:hypothetical protein
MNQRPRLFGFSRAPGPQYRGMFARRAFAAAFRPKMSLYVALSEGVKPTQNLGRHGL